MWKHFWRTWTIDKPAALGDWIWQVFVVELAALLDRLTIRQVIAFIPVAILIVAYVHRIPLPPELLLVGDVLAYIDVLSMIALLGLLGRIATILYVLQQAAQRVRRLARDMRIGFHRRASRQPRVNGPKQRKRWSGRTDEDGDGAIYGVAWA